MRKLQCLVLVLAIAGYPPLAAGQAGALYGPVLGYVPDAGAIRPILGTPGASLLGAPLHLGFETTAAVVSPAQDYVIAVSAEDGLVQVVNLGAATLEGRAVEGAAPGPDRLVLSPRGRAALLLTHANGTAQVVTGLPAAPVAIALDLSNLPGKPGAVAVSDDAVAILAATPEGLFLVAVDGQVRPLPSSGPISALAFLPDSLDALAAGPGQVALLRDAAGQPAWRVLAALNEEFGDPVEVAALGARAVVAASRAVAAVDMKTGQASTLACSFEVTALARLNGDVFRLTGASAQPVWIVEGGPETRLLFVPAAPVEPSADEGSL